MFQVYFAPVGDPALGPVAFPHRASASELPQAPIGHHWEDSTHIANEVVTAGISHGIFRLEASGFHGREPNENRWNIDYGAIDSWSTRVSIFPTSNWMGQVSMGRLHSPEALEQGDEIRSTASLHYSKPIGNSFWSTSLIWGRNHKTAEHRDSDAYGLESVAPIGHNNFLTGRIEAVDKDELFDAQPEIKALLERTAGVSFRIEALYGRLHAGHPADAPYPDGRGSEFQCLHAARGDSAVLRGASVWRERVRALSAAGIASRGPDP